MYLDSLINEPLFPVFFRVLQSSQEKSKTMVMQSFGGWTRCIVVYVKMVNSNADWQKGYRTHVNSTASEFARFRVNGLQGKEISVPKFVRTRLTGVIYKAIRPKWPKGLLKWDDIDYKFVQRIFKSKQQIQ